MKAHLSTIDTRAKPGAKRATWKQRNDPPLDRTQQPEYEALVARQAVFVVRRRAHHVSLGLKARMSRDDTAPSN